MRCNPIRGLLQGAGRALRRVWGWQAPKAGPDGRAIPAPVSPAAHRVLRDPQLRRVSRPEAQEAASGAVAASPLCSHGARRPASPSGVILVRDEVSVNGGPAVITRFLVGFGPSEPWSARPLTQLECEQLALGGMVSHG